MLHTNFNKYDWSYATLRHSIFFALLFVAFFSSMSKNTTTKTGRTVFTHFSASVCFRTFQTQLQIKLRKRIEDLCKRTHKIARREILPYFEEMFSSKNEELPRVLMETNKSYVAVECEWEKKRWILVIKIVHGFIFLQKELFTAFSCLSVLSIKYFIFFLVIFHKPQKFSITTRNSFLFFFHHLNLNL